MVNKIYKRKKLMVTLLIVAVVAAAALWGFAPIPGEVAERERDELVIGYFPNLTHAPAMVGLEEGYYEEELDGVEIKTETFPDGSLFMDSLLTGAVDVGFVGPGPALNRFVEGGEVVNIAGASNAGNIMVAAPGVEIDSAQDLDDRVVATPALGCTHDLQLRKMIDGSDLSTTRRGGTIDHRTQAPANVAGLFRRGQMDAAVVSEPWASRIEEADDGHVVLEWDEVPWEGDLPATITVASEDIYEQEEEIIESFLEAHERSVEFLQENPEESARIIQKQIDEITQEELELSVLESSLERTVFSTELDREAVEEMAEISEEHGFVSSSDLEGFFRLNSGD